MLLTNFAQTPIAPSMIYLENLFYLWILPNLDHSTSDEQFLLANSLNLENFDQLYNGLGPLVSFIDLLNFVKLLQYYKWISTIDIQFLNDMGRWFSKLFSHH